MSSLMVSILPERAAPIARANSVTASTCGTRVVAALHDVARRTGGHAETHPERIRITRRGVQFRNDFARLSVLPDLQKSIDHVVAGMHRVAGFAACARGILGCR